MHPYDLTMIMAGIFIGVGTVIAWGDTSRIPNMPIGVLSLILGIIIIIALVVTKKWWIK